MCCFIVFCGVIGIYYLIEYFNGVYFNEFCFVCVFIEYICILGFDEVCCCFVKIIFGVWKFVGFFIVFSGCFYNFKVVRVVIEYCFDVFSEYVECVSGSWKVFIFNEIFGDFIVDIEEFFSDMFYVCFVIYYFVVVKCRFVNFGSSFEIIRVFKRIFKFFVDVFKFSVVFCYEFWVFCDCKDFKDV